MGGFVDRLVKVLAFGFVLEAPDPHVNRVVVLTREATEDDHALSDLEGNDFIFHKANPALLMAIPDLVLAEFEKHWVLATIIDRQDNSYPVIKSLDSR